jgi:hypothetical protein
LQLCPIGRCDRGARAVARMPEQDESENLMEEMAAGRAEAALLGPKLTQALDGIPSCDRDALLLMAWNGLRYE